MDWLTSLLDGHKQILMMPSFSFFRCFYYIKVMFPDFDTQLINMSNLEIVKIFTKYFKNDFRQNIPRRKFLYSKKDFKIFEENLVIWLNESNIQNKYERLFLGIHYAFSKVYKIDLKKIKILAIQEHTSLYSERYVKMINPNFVFIVRDPRATIAGSILRMEKYNQGRILANQFDQIILQWKLPENFIEKKKYNKKLFIIKNEKMHKNLTKEMRNLSKWLNIRFQNTLLKQTVLGKKWFGESSYLQGKNQEIDLKKPPPKNFYYPKEVEKRWKSQLNTAEIEFTEIIFFNSFKKFNYKFLKKKNFADFVKSYLYFLANYNYQKKYFFSKHLIILRNILRKIVILINPTYTKFIYNKFH